MEEQTTSSSTGVTPTTGSPVMGTPASGGVTPSVKPATTLEEALARIAELEHSVTNKAEENDRHSKKLKSYEEAERKVQEAALSEVEKATKRASEAEQRIAQIQQQYVTAQIQLAAQKKNIIDPEIAALAVQKSLEYDENGIPTNLDKALDELIKNKPYLVPQANQAPPASAAQTARPPLTPAMNPGRTNIPSPNQLTPGKRYKLSDLL